VTMENTVDDKNDVAEHIQATVEDLGPCKKKLTITLDADHITEEFRKTYQKLGETMPVKGFRPGHVPRALLERKFGKDVQSDVRATLVPDSFEEAMKANDLVMIGEPDIDFEAIELQEGEALTFEVSVEVRPTFELGEYKGLEAEAVPVEVTDADIDGAVSEILSDRATLVPADDGVSRERDLLVLDVTLTVDGEEVETQENIHYSLPSEVLLDLRVADAPEKLDGRKIDDAETFALTIPDTYKREEHQGKEAELAVTIRDIKRLRIPELDDELAKELDFDDAEDLRDEVRVQVERGKKREAEHVLEDNLLDMIIENTPFDLPEGLVKKELDRALQRAIVDLQMEGASEAEIAEKVTILQSESEERVKREFRETLILEAVAEKERVYVTENEIREEVTGIGARYGRSYEDMLEYLEGQDSISTLRARLREGKAKEFIRQRAKIVDNS
jgi:trigger factor